MLRAIGHNLTNLGNFNGRETRGQFWPYVATVMILAIAGMTAVLVPAIVDMVGRMQRFAVQHPELATVHSEPGNYSISIQGYHPELMPDMGGIMAGAAVVAAIAVALLAAAVTRRLHDRGRSGFWGLLPIPFIVVALLAMPHVFTGGPPHLAWFFLLFINNALYLASLITLIVMLAGRSRTDTRDLTASA